MGNYFKTTSTARRLKAPDPSANIGKEIKEKKAGVERAFHYGVPSYRGCEGALEREMGKFRCKADALGRVDVKAILGPKTASRIRPSWARDHGELWWARDMGDPETQTD